MNHKRKLHPFFILFGSWKLIKENLFAVIILFVLNFGTERTFMTVLQILLIAYLFIRLSALILKWFTYKYKVSESAIHINSGIFKKSQQVVPIQKIQNTNRQTTLFHKFFNVTSLTLETGLTGMNSSVKFDAISLKEADVLEKIVASNRKVNVNVSEELDDMNNGEQLQSEEIESLNREVHFTPTKKQLLKASFTSFSFLAIIPFIFAIYDNLGEFLDIDGFADEFVRMLQRSWWIASIIVVIFILFAVIFGVVRTFLKYGKYEISSDDKNVYIKKGILEEISFTIQKDKVQAVKVNQSLIKRILRIAEVQLISAGNAGDIKNDTNSLYPFLPIGQVYSIVEGILPEYKINKNMNSLSKPAFMMRMLRPSFIWLLISAMIIIFKQNLWYLSLLLFLLIYLLRIFDYKNSGYLINDEFIQLKSGSVWTTFIITKRSKIIEIEAKQTKLQRRFHLSTVKIINRSKPMVTETNLKDIPEKEAASFYHWYVDRLQEIKFE